jgi:hypothetical protein
MSTLRLRIQHRAHSRCEYCGIHQDQHPFLVFHVEHVLPRQHGGSNSLNNLAWACPHCNRRKSCNLTSFDPRTKKLARLFHPRTMNWHAHFKSKGARIVGITLVGRATVQLLQMNHEDRVALRQFFLSQGQSVVPDR